GGGNPNDILFSKPEQSAFLFEAFPNPSSGSVTVRFSLEKSEPAKLTVFNTTGELLQEIAFDAGEKGSQTYSWNGNNVPTGLYLFKLDIGGKSESKLISLLR
ncbi:MAG: T9SS type A sorting domain-containing protein, partial [Bacteroidota bacterium]